MNKKEKAVLARRKEIEEACKEARACKEEYKKLLKSDDEGFINVLKRNYGWCLRSRVLKLSDFGKKIHYKDSDGYEWRKEYDEKGNCIHSKDSDGYEWRKEYDEKGNCIYYKNSDGDEWWRDKNKHESKENEGIAP